MKSKIAVLFLIVLLCLSGDSNSPFLRDTVAAQSKLTIRDPWGAQEDVVVKVDS